MKTLTLFLTVLMLAFSGFGQKKPVRKKTVKPPTKTVGLYESPVVEKPNPTERVIVNRNGGKERLVGFFVGGDTESIVVRTDEGEQTVKIADVESITFVRNKLTVVGADSQETFRGKVLTVADDAAKAPNGISGGVLNGKAVSLPKPVYPPAAAAVRAGGAVNVQVTIDEEGNIVSAAAISGHPLLRQAAENAARASKFSPTLLEGQPVSVTGIIVYNFVP